MAYVIPNIPEAVYRQKEKKIRRSPCHSNRASGLGYSVPELGGCLRRGVYERTHWQEKRLHDGRLQLIFDEGNNQEALIYRDALDAGMEIIEQQTPYAWPDYEITGHIDGKLIAIVEGTDARVGIPLEIKSMAPHIFDSVNAFEDFKKKPWTRSYMVQITLYMLMENIDTAVFLLKNKSTGELKQIVVNLDYELGEAALKTAEQINKHVKAGTMPDYIQDIDKCKDCPFNLICKPDVNFGEEMTFEDDPDMEAKLDKYFELKDAHEECEELVEKKIKPKFKASAKKNGGALNVSLGKYIITGKEDSRGSIRLKFSKP